MTEERSPIDAALDVFVFLPFGLAATAAEEFPKLAAKGRAQLLGRLTVARMVGEFAVTQGRREFGRRLGQVARPGASPNGGTVRTATSAEPHSGPGGAAAGVAAAVAAGGDVAGAGVAGRGPAVDHWPQDPDDPVVPETATDIAATAAASSGDPVVAETATDIAATAAASSGDLPSESPAPDAAGLAIPGYDSLSASQVVQRLDGLSRDELAAVGEYESAHRARRTVLTRVSQLQGRA
jgi:hypothetical protein